MTRTVELTGQKAGRSTGVDLHDHAPEFLFQDKEVLRANRHQVDGQWALAVLKASGVENPFNKILYCVSAGPDGDFVFMAYYDFLGIVYLVEP